MNEARKFNAEDVLDQSRNGVRGQRQKSPERRVKELEEVCRAALSVNKLLTQELDLLALSLDKAAAESTAWQQRAADLAAHLKAERIASGRAAGFSNEAGVLGRADVVLTGHRSPSGVSGVTRDEGLTTEALASLMAAMRAKGQSAGWLLASSEVTLDEVLGEGSFGVTRKGTVRGAAAAIKMMRVESCDAANMLSFLRVVECQSMIRHPHVVPFLGAVLEPPERCWLVTEFMPGGTLGDWLYLGRDGRRMPTSTRPVKQRLQLAAQVASALWAMQEADPPILHRDIKPANIYLDTAGAARVGDFGLSRRRTGAGADLTGETGSYLYMAPEVIRHEIYDSTADVWSWGVLLSEMLSGVPPYSHTYLTPVQIAMGVADGTLLPALPGPVDAPADFQVMAQLATAAEPELRPDFRTIVTELAPAVEALQSQSLPESRLLSRLHVNLPATWQALGAAWKPIVHAAAVEAGFLDRNSS